MFHSTASLTQTDTVSSWRVRTLNRRLGAVMSDGSDPALESYIRSTDAPFEPLKQM
jgi:hypothetical protein